MPNERYDNLHIKRTNIKIKTQKQLDLTLNMFDIRRASRTPRK